MTNPFTQHLKSSSAGAGPANPFIPTGGGTAVAEPAPENPFLAAPPSEQPTGAAAIAGMEEGNIKQNIDALKALLQKPGITPAQRQRLEGMIQRYTEPSIAGFPVGNRVTATDRSAASNLARGAATGAINYGLLGASDLALAGVGLLLPKSWEKYTGLTNAREAIADSQQIVKEWFDPQGYAGGVGTVAGAIAPGFVTGGGAQITKEGVVAGSAGKAILTSVINPFHVLNSQGFRALARLSPSAAAIVAKGTEPGAKFLERLAAQWVGSSAVDAVQVADVLTNDQLTTDQKIKAIAFAAVASGGAATAAAIRKIKPSAADIAELKRQAKIQPPDKPQAGATPARAAEADAMAKKAEVNQEAAKVNRRLTRGARAEWEAQNPSKDWKKDLTEEMRTDIITKYKARYAKPNISPAAPEAAPTAGTPSAETPAPPSPPAPTPGAEGAPPADLSDQLDKGLAAVGLGRTAGGEGTAPSGAGEAPAVAGAVEPPRVGEVDPTSVQPAETPVDAVIAQLQAELANTREQRDLAVRQAETDQMTGVANTNAWLKALPNANKDPNAKFLLFDLQNVKFMNDKVSRAEADQYIIDAARAIETSARAHASDPKQTPRVFRYGGDEFAIILPAGADHEAVAATARQILGTSAIDGFELGLRHSAGNTATEAESAMAAVKAGEKGKKYRPLAAEFAKVEQLVPGAELKKPLAEHSVEELDKLYDQIDNLFEAKKINEQAYANGILAVSEAKRQLKARGVKVESLEPAKREKIKTSKVDNAAAKDAGYMPGEYKSADPKVNEGYAFMDGELRPVDRPALEKIKTFENSEIDKWEARRVKVMELPDRQLTAQEVDGALGFGDNRGQSRGEVLSLIERKIRGAKAEIDRFTRQHARYNEANPSSQPPPRANPADVTGSAVQRSTAPLPESKVAPELRKVTDPTVFKKQFTSRLDKMGAGELEAHRDDLSARLVGMDKRTAKDSGYIERLAKVNEELAKRADKSSGGVILRTDPRVVGFAAGFAAGMVAPADDEQERWRNALYLGLAGAGLTHGYMRTLQRAAADRVPDYQQEIRKHVKSVEDAPLEHRKGIYSRLLEKYGNIARRDIGITATIRLSGGRNLPAGRNAGKLAEVFGLWRSSADRWIMGDRVGTFDRDGNWVQFNAKSIRQIAGMVDGDIRTVGDLAAARRELELRSMPEPRTTGLSLEAARKMYANTAEKYHVAAQELTNFFRAMKDLSVMSGLLSTEASKKMDEQTFYVALRRLFPDEPGTTPQVIDVKAKGKKKTASAPEQLFKFLRGSKLPYQNPVEAAIDLVPRYHRAAELNRLTTEFFDHLAAIPASDRALIGRRLSKAETPKVAGEDVKIQQLRDELAAAGNHIGENEARAIISALSNESLNITDDVVRFYRNGEMEAWRVSEPIARAFRALQPHELEAIMAGTGILTKPTNLARVGITANPVFVGYQAIRDMWQFHQNGTYATQSGNPLVKIIQAPFSLAESGIGSMRGWLNIMFRSGEYRNYQDVGAGGESVAGQGLRVVRGDVKRSTDRLDRVKEAPTKNQFDQIVKEIRAGDFREAYSSILAPIADAGRVGAYLKERGRGADVIEAVYRAKKAGANFSNRGDSVALQALNRMTLFLNPAIQGLDASRHAFQTDPVGYVARGIAGITIPSMLLWAAYKDDEEITQLRATPSGKRFWFFRLGGEIRKIPKPIFDGQVFGSSMESYLDSRYKDDPDAMKNWAEGMYNDAAVNLLPFIGVAPISLMTGKVVGLGSDITPPATEGLDVEYRARPDNTTLSRIVSKTVAPAARALNTDFTDNALSPAGVDFLIQNYLGGAGSELSKVLSTAIDVQRGGQLPPKEELPFIRSAFGQYPSMNTAAIQEFYTHAERAEQAANTAAFIARTKPEELATYLETRMNEIQLAKMYSTTRNEISDLRKAMEDIRQAPREVIDDSTKRELTKMFMEQMILKAKIINDVARTLDEHISKEEEGIQK